MKLLIKNGTIINFDKEFKADILIQNEKISKIAKNIKEEKNCEIINADGKFIIPGGIDPHTHFDLPIGNGVFSSDDFFTGGKAAAMGGTTTVIDFVTPKKKQSLSSALKTWEKKSKKSPIDFAFHMSLCEWNSKLKKEISSLSKKGITSLKCYMAYKDILQLDDETLFDVFKTCKKYKILPSVHAENGDIIALNIKKLIDEKKISPKYHAISRPEELEAEAILRAAIFAREAKSPLYIVHLSSKAGLNIALHLKKTQKIILETCPQYFTLDDSLYDSEGFEGAKYICSPPLRDKKSNKALISALKKNDIEILATDHCPFCFKGQKDKANKNKSKIKFNEIPNGMPGVETRMAVSYTELVKKNKISKRDFVALTSTNAAKTFGMFPQKGIIKKGSDADLVIFSDKETHVITQNNQHSRVDYTPFEGHVVNFKIDRVIQRGKILVQTGIFIGKEKQGKFIKRK